MIEVVDLRGEDIDLLRGLAPATPRWRGMAVLGCSAILHVFFLLIAIRLPSLTMISTEPGRRVIVHRTPLYLPPDVMTQKAPNRGDVSKSIDLASLLAKQAEAGRRTTRAAPRQRPEAPSPAAKTAPPTPVTHPEAPKILPEQPKMASTPPPGVPAGLPTPPAPPPPPAAKPVENPFQNVGSETPINPKTPLKPKTDVLSAIQGLAPNAPGRRMVISDDAEAPAASGAPNTPGVTASPHTAIELQSDPQGADFKAYLTQILAIVRSNWKRVIPESARMGQIRGQTRVEFIINRDGKIPKLVIADSSGSDPLDRAAGAGITMSDPLPPLPQDYRGFQVRLAFTFSYNMPAR